MSMREIFPLGKAYGAAFCNRVFETQQLVGHIQSSKHTLLIAPRRYGKSSLAEKALQTAGFPHGKVNFHLATSESELIQLVLDAVTKLIGQAIGSIEKWKTSLKQYLVHLEPFISLGTEYAHLKLSPKPSSNTASILCEALLLLEKLLCEKNTKAVLFFDEFQELTCLSKHRGLEGAFRTAAQEMRALSLIFSGSFRSLLLGMFEDEGRPLYKLCRKIKLERITAHEYEKHIQAIAQTTWQVPLEKTTFDRIIELSERHPYYVNYLCDRVWEANPSHVPGSKEVNAAWQGVIAEEWRSSLKEIAFLSLRQRHLLKHIALYGSQELQSQKVAQQLSMPLSSIATALHVLIDKDYLEQERGEQYAILNPVLAAILRGADPSLESL